MPNDIHNKPSKTIITKITHNVIGFCNTNNTLPKPLTLLTYFPSILSNLTVPSSLLLLLSPLVINSVIPLLSTISTIRWVTTYLSFSLNAIMSFFFRVFTLTFFIIAKSPLYNSFYIEPDNTIKGLYPNIDGISFGLIFVWINTDTQIVAKNISILNSIYFIIFKIIFIINYQESFLFLHWNS